MADSTTNRMPAQKADNRSCGTCSGSENIGALEKSLSLAAGGALLLYGLKRAGGAGVLGMLVGGALLYRGTTGYCATYDALGIDTADDSEAGKPSSRISQKFRHKNTQMGARP